MIVISQLNKTFGRKQVLTGIDIQIGQGESLALVGPNGAGKTTLLRILATLCRATSGAVTIGGLDTATQAAPVRKMLGFVAPQPLLYGGLTARENLVFYGKLYGVPNPKVRAEQVLEQMELTVYKDELVRTFSSGMQQRLAIGRALLHDPQVLLLDEAFNTLDQTAGLQLQNLLQELQRQGKVLLLASHDLSRAASLCGRCIMLDRGRVQADISLDGCSAEELKNIYDQTFDKSRDGAA